MKKFDHELADLQRRLSDMSHLTREMVGLIAEVVKDPTRDVAERLAHLERVVNQTQMDIDGEAIRMMTIYGPVAADLRYVLVCTHVTSQMERMGDQAMNICEAMNLMRSDAVSRPMLSNITKMADLTCQMVDDAFDAYFSRNPEKAAATRANDDLVDALNDQVMSDLLTGEVLKQVLDGAQNIGDAVAQILIARNLERIADQATNICKETIYLVKGDDVRHKRLATED